MVRVRLVLFALVLAILVPVGAQAQDVERITLSGLDEPVEILKDRWGIAHIYAETEHDLFFAQGWSAARDRLFQLETWRRQATGTVAEILGERELRRDIGTRLFKFRGDMEAEMNHYHPRGAQIIPAFVNGINAYVDMALADESLLSVEFDILGIRPGHWTPADVISRHQGLLMNVTSELQWGRAVHAIGDEAVKEIADFHPQEPDIALDPAIDGSLLSADILGLYNAFRGPIRFRPEDVTAEYRADGDIDAAIDALQDDVADPAYYDPRKDDGSNNWIVSGALTESGYPMMANDPHRVQAAPSLRYWAHLVGPGWNVIGGGEPVLPGISIGHNGYGAWGLTVFVTDNEDLYVYETDPADRNQYRYMGEWEDMEVLTETIPVKGRSPETVQLKYTRHGPVVYEDPENDVAYAVRAGWMDIGGAPYLASLRMNQARTWGEFRSASDYSNTPGENMIWADREGNIGWQAVGIAPLRRNFSGLVPVPGDGRYEWDGYLPIRDKPHVVNPPEGFFATANESNTPLDYEGDWDAIGFEWSDPYRVLRAQEVLASGRKFSMADMMALQTDEVSLPARALTAMLADVAPSDAPSRAARETLLDWDHTVSKESVAAGIYIAWERRISRNLYEQMVPEVVRPHIGNLSMTKQIEWLTYPDGRFGTDPVAGRDALLVRSLDEAVAGLTERFGPDPEDWRYGQNEYKHILLRHPLSAAVDAETRDLLEVGPVPRGGYVYTLNQTGYGDNQTSGASFRIIVDTSDWDRTVGMNNPGQGGHPGHPHYEDLFELWAADRFHPVFYTREKIESVTGERIELVPGG